MTIAGWLYQSSYWSGVDLENISTDRLIFTWYNLIHGTTYEALDSQGPHQRPLSVSSEGTGDRASYWTLSSEHAPGTYGPVQMVHGKRGIFIAYPY